MCFIAHVQFSRCPKLEPHLHSEVLSSRGSSLVGVDVHNVAVALFLGMSDSANTFELIIVPWLEFGKIGNWICL